MISKFAFAGLLSLMVACGSSLPLQENEQEQSAATEEGLQGPTSTQGTAPQNAGCGYTCVTNGAIEMSWRVCSRLCPGGSDNCVPTPQPCP